MLCFCAPVASKSSVATMKACKRFRFVVRAEQPNYNREGERDAIRVSDVGATSSIPDNIIC